MRSCLHNAYGSVTLQPAETRVGGVIVLQVEGRLAASSRAGRRQTRAQKPVARATLLRPDTEGGAERELGPRTRSAPLRANIHNKIARSWRRFFVGFVLSQIQRPKPYPDSPHARRMHP